MIPRREGSAVLDKDLKNFKDLSAGKFLQSFPLNVTDQILFHFYNGKFMSKDSKMTQQESPNMIHKIYTVPHVTFPLYVQAPWQFWKLFKILRKPPSLDCCLNGLGKIQDFCRCWQPTALQNVFGSSSCCPQYSTLHTTSHAQLLEMTVLHNAAETGTEKVVMPLCIPGKTVCLSYQVSSFCRWYLCNFTQPQIIDIESTSVPL